VGNVLVKPRISGGADAARYAAEFVRAALRWWFGELHDLMPARIKMFFSGDGERLRVRVDNGTIHVERADATEHWEFPFEGDSEVPAPLRELLQDGAGAVLLLPRDKTLRRKVQLPLAAASELRAATSFLIDRLTPFRAEQTYHSARLLSRDRARKLLWAELVVVPRERLDGLVATLAAHRIPVSAVRIEGEGSEDLDFTLGQAGGAWFRVRVQEAWKPVLATGLALLVLGPLVVAYRIHSEAEALAVEVAAAQGPGQRAAALRSEVEARAAEQAFLPAHQRSLRAIEVLDALTKAIPEDSWLFSMELRSGQVVLAGFSPDVPALVERLTRAPFAAPELTAPVVNGLAGGKSRFELRVQVKDVRS
jgi:general secretion pathway protein L